MFVRLLAITAIVTCSCLPLSAGAAPAGLDFEALRKVVTVSTPEISPDGRFVVYVRSQINWDKDTYDTGLVLADVQTGMTRAITHERIAVSSPQWSPSGDAIAYLSSPEKDKPPQLYVLAMNGGDSLRVTDAPNGVDSFAWSNDGKQLAYTARNESPDKSAIEKHHDAVVITDQDYLTRTQIQPTHLWAVAPDGTGNRRLTDGTWSVVAGSRPVWSNDDTKIYYQRQPDPIFAHFVQQTTYVHDIAAKTDTSLGIGVDQSAALAPDGKSLAVTLPRHQTLYLTNDISVRSAADGSQLWNSGASLDRNVHAARWMPDSQRMLIETADGVRSVAWIVSQKGATKLPLGDLDISQASVSRTGTIAFVGQRVDRYPEIYALLPGAAAPKELSNENAWTANYAIARSVPFEWKTDAGVTATGVLHYPVGYVAGKQYPLVLDIHGGPVSASTVDLAGLESGSLDQVLAARGYLVFQPNYRGSDNLGDAFLMAIVGDMASGPGKDNLAAVEALKATGMVDASRIFVSGWSGGGLQTSWLIGHADYWRAAVSGAAVDDQYLQAVLSDINEDFNKAFFPNVSPFTAAGRNAYDAESPITYVSKVKTPTLILTDTQDQRVPIPQSFEFYHALKQHGVTVQLTEFPRAGHFPTDPVGRELALRAWAGWFDRWMK